MATIQHRRGTAAQWASSIIVLAPGEMGLETDTSKFKFGNGSALYSALPYATAGTVTDGVYTTGDQTIGGVKTFTAATDLAGGLKQDGNTILNGSDTWLRTTGQTGWYSTTYTGGWYMTDTTTIRAYNDKDIYTAGHNYSQNTPYAMSAGAVTVPGGSGSYSQVFVTFPSGRFSVAPIVTVTPDSSVVGTTVTGWSVNGVNATGFNARVLRSNATGTPFFWQAVQMTSGSAGG